MPDFLTLLYLFLPAFLANAAPIFAKNLPLLRDWKTPIYAPLLGKNKTWRGLIFGTLLAILLSILQFYLAPFLPLPLHASLSQSILVGFLLGFGALFGDLAESLLKRQMHLKPGAPLPILDGIDYILGALLFLSPLYLPDFWGIIFLLVLAPLLSLLANLISYFLGWKDVWY